LIFFLPFVENTREFSIARLRYRAVGEGRHACRRRQLRRRWTGRLIGEVYLSVERLMHYYGRERAEVHLPFDFQLIDTPWEARALATLIANYEAALPPGGWPNWVLGNHDRPRVAAKRGQAQARVAAMLLLTLRGTPTLYYGDELGLSDVAIPPAQVQDPRELREPGLGLGRDPVRTPMPWDGSRNAGFTTGRPWLPLNPDWPARNAVRSEKGRRRCRGTAPLLVRKTGARTPSCRRGCMGRRLLRSY
jgi:hypothetical protein